MFSFSSRYDEELALEYFPEYYVTGLDEQEADLPEESSFDLSIEQKEQNYEPRGSRLFQLYSGRE